MCIFSGSIHSVKNTRIFVSDLGEGIHGLVYEMLVDIEKPVAMILPVPIENGSELEFVNLKGYEDFFSDMNSLFISHSRSRKMVIGCAAGPLKVHDVGDFDASFVPNKASFLKLDERFRLPSGIWRQLPAYTGWGYAVFQLKSKHDSQKIHPMAFKYKSNNPDRLFFPTVHVHDGSVPQEAEYDHHLYFQRNDKFGESDSRSEVSLEPIKKMDIEKTQGLVNRNRLIERFTVYGKKPNKDYFVLSFADRKCFLANTEEELEGSSLRQ